MSTEKGAGTHRCGRVLHFGRRLMFHGRLRLRCLRRRRHRLLRAGLCRRRDLACGLELRQGFVLHWRRLHQRLRVALQQTHKQSASACPTERSENSAASLLQSNAGKPLEGAATFTPAKFGPVGTHSRIWGVNGRTSSPRVLSVSGWAFGSASRPAGSSADGAGAGAKDGGGGTCHARAHKCVPDEVGAR